MKRLLTDIPQQQILNEVKQHALKRSLPATTSLLPLVQKSPIQTFLSHTFKERDVFQESSSLNIVSSGCDQEEHLYRRFRNQSSFSLEEQYNFSQYTQKKTEEMLEDNEDQYALNGLESCLRTFHPLQFSKQFEYFNSQTNNQIKEDREEQIKEEDLLQEIKTLSKFQSLDSIIEDPTEKEGISNCNNFDPYNTENYAGPINTNEDANFFQYQQQNKTIEEETSYNHSNNETMSDETPIASPPLKLKTLKLKKKNSSISTHTSSIYRKNQKFEEFSNSETGSEEKRIGQIKSSSNLIKKKSNEDTIESTQSHAFKGMIGPLTSKERMEKVLKFLQRKRLKSQMKKFCYKCRKQVAEKRLRIKGRFVTKQQAFEILGLTSDELKGNEIIQKLLETHSTSEVQPKIQLNSLVESENGKKQIKIRNFQALIDDNYTHNSQQNKIFTSTMVVQNQQAPSIQQELKKISLNEDELIQQISLNLRISTTKSGEDNKNPLLNNQVSKVLISNFPSQNLISIEENLKKSLSNFKIEGYIQPLFRIEKTL